MQILRNRLSRPERVFFASAQALLCCAVLFVGYTAARALWIVAAGGRGAMGPGLTVMFVALLAFALAAAGVAAFLAVTFARGARIGVSRHEALLFRALLAIAVAGCIAASVALRL